MQPIISIKDLFNDAGQLAAAGYNKVCGSSKPTASSGIGQKIVDGWQWIIAADTKPELWGKSALTRTVQLAYNISSFVMAGSNMPTNASNCKVLGYSIPLTSYGKGVVHRVKYLHAGNSPTGPQAPHGINRALVIALRMGIVAAAGVGVAAIGWVSSRALEALGTSLLQHSSTQTGLAADILQYSAQASAWLSSMLGAASNSLYLGISVPFFLVTHTFPKYCLKELPNITAAATTALSWLNTNVGKPVANVCGNGFEAATQYLPCLNDTVKCANYISQEIITPAYNFVYSLLAKAMETFA